MAKTKIPYYKYLAECIRTAGQELVDHAEDFAGKKDMISDCRITITFNQEIDASIPRIFVEHEYCPAIERIEKLLEYENTEETDGDT